VLLSPLLLAATCCGWESLEATAVTGVEAETLEISIGRILCCPDRDRLSVKGR